MPDHDMTYPHAPVMTQRHADQLWQVCRLWPYPGHADQATLLEIHAHLEALLAQPVPSWEHDEPEALTFPDLLLKANQHIIDQIVAMNADDLEAKTRHEVESHSHPDWRQEFTPPTAEDCYEDCDQ